MLQPARETRPQVQCSVSECTLMSAFSVQLRLVGPIVSRLLMVPSRLPSLDISGCQWLKAPPPLPLTWRLAAENFPPPL